MDYHNSRTSFLILWAFHSFAYINGRVKHGGKSLAK